MSYSDRFPIPKEWISDMDIAVSKTVKEWAENEVISKRLELKEDYERLIAPALHSLLLDVGLQRSIWPEEHGGDGLTSGDAAFTLTAAIEEVGRADTGMGFALASAFALASTFAMEPNMNTDITTAMAPLFCQNEKAAVVSLILPALSADSENTASELEGRRLQVKARESDGSWVLQTKDAMPLSSGATATLFGVVCEAEGETEPVFILVPGDTAGISRGQTLLRTGLFAAPNAPVSFDRVEVPGAYCAFRGVRGYRSMLSWLYLLSAATCVGSLFAVYEMIGEWGDSRVIKGRGQVFKENPLTASLMAYLARSLNLSRLLVYDLAHMISRPGLYGHPGEDVVYLTASNVAHQVSNSAEKSINQVMELMGSAGYATEWSLERYWRDVKTLQLNLGSDILARMELARFYYDCQSL